MTAELRLVEMGRSTGHSLLSAALSRLRAVTAQSSSSLGNLSRSARPLIVGRMLPVIALLLPCSAASAGPDWDEIGDAGPLRSRAQILFGAGPVQTIAGTFALSALAGGDEDEDAQDMYRLVIVNPVQITFSAGTAAAFGGESDLNTKLWLFDADGLGLLANDDFDGPQSGFFDVSDDGTKITIDQPGVYFLAVSSSESEPVDEFGQPIFFIDQQTEISGPDGLGGGGAIAGWSGRGAPGFYVIGLTGAGFSPLGDFSGDGAVDGADLAQILADWGLCLTTGSCPADLNFDGVVDASDLGLLLANWG